jgi:hypothetical protein
MGSNYLDIIPIPAVANIIKGIRKALKHNDKSEE